eukprot:Nk52_evm1s150 gene=Nk52_evmTU1s150
MRRVTLGALTPSQANTRASLGPTRLKKPARVSGIAGRRTSGVDRRMSTAAVTQNNASDQSKRRQSAFGERTIRKDPRPLSDKGYIAKEIRCLIKFLTEMGYNHPVSPKLLTAPALKDFQRIFQFIFNIIDPNYKFGAKYEEEIPALLLGIGYPFKINKSALFAVGSPHAWPNLLGALTWMVDLIKIQQHSQKDREAKNEMNDNKILFAYVSRSYEAYLNFDPKYEEIDGEFQNDQIAKTNELQNAVSSLSAQKESLEKELSKMKSNASPLEVAKKRREDLSRDSKKFHKLIESLRAHKKAHEMKLEQCKKDISSLKLEQQELTSAKASLEQEISEQTMSASDAEQLKGRKSEANDKLNALKKKREEVDKTVWEREMIYSKSLGLLEDAVTRYNQKGEELRLIPKNAKNALGIDYELRLDVHASNPEEMLSIDLKGVKPSLRKLCERLAEERRTLEEALLMAKEQADLADDFACGQNEEVAMWEKKVRQAETTYKEKKIDTHEQYTRDVERVEAVEETVLEKRNALRKLQAQFHALESDLSKAKQHKDGIVDKYSALFIDTLELCTAHVSNVQNTLADLSAFANTVKDRRKELSEA